MRGVAVAAQEQRRTGLVELDQEHVETPVAIGVEGRARDPVPRVAGALRGFEAGHAVLDAEVAEHRRSGAVVRRRRGQDVGPAVGVDVDDLHVGRLRGKADETRLLGDVAESRRSVGAGALVEVEPHRYLDAAVDGAVVMLADDQVAAAVPVHVAYRDAGGVVLLAVGLPGEHLGVALAERAGAVVDEQAVGAGDEQIGPTVAAEIGSGHPQAVHVGGKAGVGGRGGKAEATLVAQQDARPSGETVLGEEQVEGAVAVIVENADGAEPPFGVEVGGDGEAAVVVAEHHRRGAAGFTRTMVAGDHQVEIAVAVEVGEGGAARAALLPRERLVEPEPLGSAEQQPIAGRAVGPGLALVGEAPDEQVGPAVVVDVADRGGMAVEAGKRLREPEILGGVDEGDAIRAAIAVASGCVTDDGTRRGCGGGGSRGARVATGAAAPAATAGCDNGQQHRGQCCRAVTHVRSTTTRTTSPHGSLRSGPAFRPTYTRSPDGSTATL